MQWLQPWKAGRLVPNMSAMPPRAGEEELLNMLGLTLWPLEAELLNMLGLPSWPHKDEMRDLFPL